MNTSIGQGDVYLEIRPSIFRRAVSVGAMVELSATLMYLAFGEQTSSAIVKAVLVLIGLMLAFLAQRFYRSTSVGIELTREELRDTNGRILCRLDEIEKVDRGAFAFKPSNGLSLTLKTSGDRVWEPGLWWRIGNKIGIGGSTAPGQAKAIADTIKLFEMEDREKIQED